MRGFSIKINDHKTRVKIENNQVFDSFIFKRGVFSTKVSFRCGSW